MARDDGGGFRYQKRTAEDVRKRAEQKSGQYDSPFKEGFNTFQPKEGAYQIRILPPTWEGATHYGLDVWMHSGVGPDSQTYLCAKRMGQGECCVCDAVMAAKRTGDEEFAKDLSPYRKVLVWMIDRDDEAKGPQLWGMPWSKVDKEIAARSIDKRTREALEVDNPEDGYDVDFSKEGSKRQTTYSGVTIARESTPLSDNPKRVQKWLDFVTENPLPEVLHYHDQDHIKAQLEGTKSASDEDDSDAPPATRTARRGKDEDEAPPPKKRPPPPADDDDDTPPVRTSRPKPPADEDEEEAQPPKKKRPAADEDEEEAQPLKKRPPVDEDEEETPPPKRQRARIEDEAPPPKKRPPADEDDEEEVPPPKKKRPPADEDEEEVPPPKKKRPPADEDEEPLDRPPKKKKLPVDDDDVPY